MKEVLHISTECYPAAKAGGMGDVVGSLPIYLPKHKVNASVIIPKYNNKWFAKHSLKTIYKGEFLAGAEKISFEVQVLKKSKLGFPFYCIDIPGKFDRSSIYLAEDGNAFPDEAERNICFQTAVVEWLLKGDLRFDALHCHDHMTGLITFFIKYCRRYKSLSELPTFFTIHNGQYRGIWDWSKADLFPTYDRKHNGMLDWDNHINGLATALKCAWQINTVSPSYMEELKDDLGSLTGLINQEAGKSSGILNGIDDALWNPATDKFLNLKLENNNWKSFKQGNKKALCKRFGLSEKKVLLSFIGRFAYEKGADLLSPVIEEYLKDKKKDINFLILGSGDRIIENQILKLAERFKNQVAVEIAYDEKLAREIYAGSDFLIMPSRFEPCGLNQMFSMRYGTIPVVRSIGGLKDTVPDINIGGNGISFDNAEVDEIVSALERVAKLHKTQKTFLSLRAKIVALDFSWVHSAGAYAKYYSKFIK